MIHRRLTLLLLLCFAANAQPYHTYVGLLRADAALLAWGTTQGGGNTIGRDSKFLGKVDVTLDGRLVATPPDRNWVELSGLRPDTEYRYKIVLLANREAIGEGALRTYPEEAQRLCFFVIGDYGSGEPPQAEVAKAMLARFEAQNSAGNPVRFVLTTGDNIYGAPRVFGLFGREDTGDQDSHWGPKLFEPYSALLRRIPFYPTLGNHDGSESEHEGDLAVYLDNFFFPPDQAQAGGRYYRFRFGRLAEFFALDSTRNAAPHSRPPGYSPQSEQYQWLERSLAASEARWKIPYFHHPRYCGGPRHGSEEKLKDLVGLFEKQGVRVVFNGHEHNWQVIEQSTGSGRPIHHVISGGGGELREKPLNRRLPPEARVLDWTPERHFLVVEIDSRRMTITPIGTDGQPVSKARVIELP